MADKILTVTQIQDASTNIDVLNEVVESTADETVKTDAKGYKKTTLEGFGNLIKDYFGYFAGFADYVAGGTSYVAFQALQDVSGDGTWYIARRDFISTDIATDLSNGNIIVWQGLTKPEGVIKVDSVEDFYGMTLPIGQHVNLGEYHKGSGVGGGLGVIRSGRHDGGKFVSLSRQFPTDWNDQAQLTAWFSDSGSDVTGFERIYDDATSIEFFGATTGFDNTQAIQKCYDISDDVIAPPKEFPITNLSFTKSRTSFSAYGATFICSNGSDPAIVFSGSIQQFFGSPEFKRSSPSDIGYYVHSDGCSGLIIDRPRFEDQALGFSVSENEQILGGILMTESYNCEVTNPRILTFGKGIFIDGDSTLYANACNQNTIRDGIVSCFNGPDIHIRGSVTNKVLRTNSEVSRYGAPTVNYGRQCHVYMNSGGTRRSQENVVEGLYYDGKGRHSCIVIEDGLYNKVKFNHINFVSSSVGEGKVVLTGAAANNTILENWFFNDGVPVLEEGTSDNNYIINNLLISGPSYSTTGSKTQVITPSSRTGDYNVTNSRMVSDSRIFKFGGGSPDLEIQLRFDSVTPNGNIFGDIGDIYVNTSGGAGTTLYIKESGVGTNTGWVGK